MPQKKIKILIIDDVPENIYLLQEMLDQDEFETITANNGKEGIRLAIDENPNLIICDIMMPELSGYDVMKILRQNPASETIPFIFLSAKNSKSDIREGMNLGADDYLTKPVSSKDLIKTIHTRLAKKNLIDKKFDGLIQGISYALPHELKTPLTGILGFSQILMEDYQTIERSDILEIAGNINSSAKRLNELIQKILLMTKLDMLAQDPEKVITLQQNATCKAETILNKVASEKVKYYNREKDLIINVQPSAIKFSEDNFKMVCQEIIDNAFKYSDDGTIVHIVGISLNNEYVISIMDNGRGMNDNQIANLGNFIQFDRAKFEQQGTGLGLSISKRLIEFYGGKIKIESIPQKQTIIRITLNRVDKNTN
jgi:two-component system, sensor histidine kinase and response regulator